jgi:predicted AAA+ superfamily ATPase
VRAVQNDILRTYTLDFAKHAPATDIPKLSIIWDSIPGYLARENKKFVFSSLSNGARAREYENALRWLCDAGLIKMAGCVEKVELPLSGFSSRSIFKVYTLDTGLLGALARIPPDILAMQTEIFSTYHGAFVENYVAQQLAASRNYPLYYWKSESQKAEIDFLYDAGSAVFPLEIKAGINPRSKSLSAYAAKFSPKLRLRSTLLNFKKDSDMLNIPLYAINNIDRYVKNYLIMLNL